MAANPVQEQRQNASYAKERGLSERKTSRLLNLTRSSLRYTPRPDRDAPLAAELAQIRSQHPRFGIRRAHALLRADGQTINRKHVARVWQKSGFQVPQRPKKRKIRMGRTVPCQDFVI